eukprot:COSAG02_NODE_4900_length_4850_cov_2.842559_1_plen_167_part_00
MAEVIPLAGLSALTATLLLLYISAFSDLDTVHIPQSLPYTVWFLIVVVLYRGPLERVWMVRRGKDMALLGGRRSDVETALYAIHPKHQKSVKNNILSGITLGCWLGLLWRRGGATKHVFRQLSGIWICCGFAHQQNTYPLHRCHRVGVLLATHLLPLIHVVCEQHR